jgi:DNA-binding MarR family transcriptional regulator
MNKLDEKTQKCLLKENKTLMMLVRDVHHLFGHNIHESFSNKGLSNTAHAILLHLNHHEFLTQVELVEKAHVRPSTMSVTLQKMENEGLITRISSTEDQRCIHVKITDLGKKVLDEGKKHVHELEIEFTKDINPSELEITKKVLYELIEKMLEDKK